MAENFEEKTEQATGRRRSKAREQGNIPRSRDLTGVMPLWVIFIYMSFGGYMLTMLLSYLRSSLKRGFEFRITEVSLMELLRTDLAQLGLILGPILGSILVVVAVVHFFQTGFLLTAEPLKADLKKLNPIQGMKRFFSLNTLFETLKGLLKVIVMGFILYFVIKKELINLPLLVDMDMNGIMSFSFGQIRKLLLISAIVLTTFAVADYAYQRWQYERNLRMTKQEVKEEHKETEGDPRVKARIRSLQREMARKRMMQEVPKADVVITNPTHFAVALKYDSSKMGAPTIIAKGANLVAAKIKGIAQQSRVPVFEDKPLARTLFKLDVGQEIPEILYRAVAAILANVYKLKNKRVTGNA
ncbi:MAG TPA: flagellar biosynthesis protein FlhB [Nitrospiraceae bacterium]|nr:MAG: flagellar biosynthesis protein FlhB [Nitrospirae bacterium GWB2_47_37]HAK87696.1 flagellar biosynthesis protein FlhB [Nitrospiraceae bacterium]HCZ12331.1 flagellar biosynthesis protein FlhB [Nitrospiraceae bacterium]